MSIRDFNFAIDPTFDPARMPKGKRKDLNRCEVTMMMPFSVQCETCSAFIYKGKKLNSTKEDILGGYYHGIKLIRFTMKCSTCNAKFCIRTDPEHMDYAVERGVKRNFEPWRQNEATIQAALTKRAEEEKYDAMRALENRTLDSKRQMDQLDALEELKAIRASQAGMTPDDLIEFIAQRNRDLGGGSDVVGGGSGYDGEGGGAGSEDDGGSAAGYAAAAAASKAQALLRQTVEDEEDAAAAAAAFEQARRGADSGSGGRGAEGAGIKRLRDDGDEGQGSEFAAAAAPRIASLLRPGIASSGSAAYRPPAPMLFHRPAAAATAAPRPIISGGARLPVVASVATGAAASVAPASVSTLGPGLPHPAATFEVPTTSLASATAGGTGSTASLGATKSPAAAAAPAPPAARSGLVAGYGSDSDADDD
jgi:hypothetical protein